MAALESEAKAMAEAGADFRPILGHYYPNTVAVSAPATRN
jgi:peptidoglycan hydrolase-like amidase